MLYPLITLQKGKDAAVRRQHPWIFSGAVRQIDGNPTDGDIVAVQAANGEPLGMGHYQKGSILVRLFTFQNEEINHAFWHAKLARAFELRRRIGLTDNPDTNAYRLVHGEGDGLTGLVIDIYNDTAVVQAHSIGMHRNLPPLVEALRELYGEKLRAIYDKSAESLPADYAANVVNGYIWGSSAPQAVSEHSNRFFVDWESGQKTGFFLDQRTNRALLGQYATNKRVLNAFCYSGGFSVYALQNGATWVDSIDASRKAIAWTEQNVQLNEAPDAPARHAAHCSDVLKFLQATTDPYDVMILDPPAFAKHLNAKHNAVQGYKRLNAEGMRKLAAGGILFTFSCSQVIDRELFYNTIVAAALEVGRSVRVLHHLSQPPDHPVSLFHPEGAYLKGLVVQVE